MSGSSPRRYVHPLQRPSNLHPEDPANYWDEDCGRDWWEMFPCEGCWYPDNQAPEVPSTAVFCDYHGHLCEVCWRHVDPDTPQCWLCAGLDEIAPRRFATGGTWTAADHEARRDDHQTLAPMGRSAESWKWPQP